MAEALAIIGAVAAVSQLTTGMVKLTTNLRRYIKAIRKAPEEVESFLLETSNFTGLLNSFIKLAHRPVQNMGRKERKERDGRVYGIEKQCAYVYNKMMKLVDRFAELADGDMTAIRM
ncbi:hypothetical protein HD806DRAFT_523313 [Xylariaceae sp. AK1471]|nr:hypothetical protein HD806DRAFT_523313 [Xylariaceae sp. AK1471]